MRLYTNLTEREIYAALETAQKKGRVTRDICFMVDFARQNSRYPEWRYSYEIQLGTYEKDSLPVGYRDQRGNKMRVRRYKNTGKRGASSYESVWAAAWHEWGWFIAEVFRLEPAACFGSPRGKNTYGSYRGSEDFHFKTGQDFNEKPQKAFSYAPSHP